MKSGQPQRCHLRDLLEYSVFGEQDTPRVDRALRHFRAIADSGARALLIGRRALVALGIPVLIADYDF